MLDTTQTPHAGLTSRPSTRAARWLLVVAVALVCGLLSACGDAESEEGWTDDGRLALTSRTSTEAHLAEDLEALMPGAWVSQQAELVGPDLTITFLGRDARTGNLAVLFETGQDEQVQPAKVEIAESGSLIRLPESGDVFLVERIDVDRLVLVDTETGARHIYHRAR